MIAVNRVRLLITILMLLASVGGILASIRPAYSGEAGGCGGGGGGVAIKQECNTEEVTITGETDMTYITIWTSNGVTFEDTQTGKLPGSCLIATAAFGSELSPEVQILRGFRDGAIMKTKAGSAFMIAFNSWYYSFSPYIATYISQHPVAAMITRLLLYPLIAIMFATARVYAIMDHYPEVAVLVSFVIASGLIGGFYFGLPLGIARWRIRRLRRFRHLGSQPVLEKPLAIALLGAIGTLILGEIFSSLGALILSTWVVVVSIMSLSAMVLSNLIVLSFEREYGSRRS
jgi:peptide/nickel transport system substrate-binding protein